MTTYRFRPFINAVQTQETPTSSKARPHCSGIWYGNCYVLEVNQNRTHARRTSEKRAPLSSSETHTKNQKVRRSCMEDSSTFLEQGQGEMPGRQF